MELREDFNHITLDDDETAEALRSAREDKHYKLKRIAYMQSLNTPIVSKKYTFEDLFSLVCRSLVVDKYNESIIRLVCMYFTGDERFNLEGYSLKKGLCLFGGVGVGKTTLMKAMFKNQVQSYAVLMCRQIEDEFSKDGDSVLKTYGVTRQTTVNGDPFGHQVLGYCFDDLGTEPNGKYFGKDANVMAEIILNRYDNDLPFNQTHITTNLSIDEIRTRYGTRVTDRMRQMFNIITFPENAKSRRE